MQKLLKTLWVFLFLCFATQPIFAQTNTTVTNVLQQNRMPELKKKATEEIDRRISALTNILNKLNTTQKLSTAQKSSFTSQIQTEINKLNSLKTKIAADQSMTVLRLDIVSVKTSYPAYAFLLPQMSIITTADSLLSATDRLTVLINKLETRIQQSKGKNITLLQTSLTEVKNKVAHAKTQANNASATVTPLTAAGYPGNRTTLETAYSQLQTAYQDLKTTRQYLQTILQGIK